MSRIKVLTKVWVQILCALLKTNWWRSTCKSCCTNMGQRCTFWITHANDMKRCMAMCRVFEWMVANAFLDESEFDSSVNMWYLIWWLHHVMIKETPVVHFFLLQDLGLHSPRPWNLGETSHYIRYAALYLCWFRSRIKTWETGLELCCRTTAPLPILQTFLTFAFIKILGLKELRTPESTFQLLDWNLSLNTCQLKVSADMYFLDLI